MSKRYPISIFDLNKWLKEKKYDYKTFLDPNDKQSDTFTLKNISKEKTWKLIKSLSPKKSSGFDEVPSKLINISAASLAAPLNMIINKAFDTGQFPKTLKLAKISPIDKKKGEKTPENHRSLNQLSGFSKVCTFRSDYHVGWKNQNKHSKLNSSFDALSKWHEPDIKEIF